MPSVLERGYIYFFYRPRIDEPAARSFEDVERLYVILHAREPEVYRRLVIGRKRMPEIGTQDRFWAYVDHVAASPEPLISDLGRQHFETKTHGPRELEPVRPAGEGVYAIVDHDGHAHLGYRLGLPVRPGAPQRELGIAPEASYVVVVRNPEALPVELPDWVHGRFDGRRFAPLAPDLLDIEGTEVVLIAASNDTELDELDAACEADLFTDLALDRDAHPIASLVAGEWA